MQAINIISYMPHFEPVFQLKYKCKAATFPFRDRFLSIRTQHVSSKIIHHAKNGIWRECREHKQMLLVCGHINTVTKGKYTL